MKNESDVRDPSVRGVAIRNGVSVPTVFRALASGALKGKKLGRRTIVLEADERAWLDALPAFRSKAAA